MKKLIPATALLTLFFIQMPVTADGEDCTISWSERSGKDAPSATVRISIAGRVTELETTSDKHHGIVSKDGNFVMYAYSYDSNGDGAVTVDDREMLKIIRVDHGGIELVRQIIDGTPMFDVTADGKKFTYIGIDAAGMYLKKYDLLDGTESMVMHGAGWLGHVQISEDDRWCALYVKNDSYDDQVVLIGANGPMTISRPVGNGWGLWWYGNMVGYMHDDAEEVTFYDPTTGLKYPKEIAATLPARRDKTKSGWPRFER